MLGWILGALGALMVSRRTSPKELGRFGEAAVWDQLDGIFKTHRINHSVAFSDDGVCTNQAESYFSRPRRSELGVHHHFSPQYLHQYASEMAWREDHRRVSTGEQYRTVSKLALAHPVSQNWKGHWQR